MVTRNWKRLLAGVGTAALLVSSLGSVSTVVFADEALGDGIPAPSDTENSNIEETPEETADLEINVEDLIQQYTEAGEEQPVVPEEIETPVAEIPEAPVDTPSENVEQGGSAPSEIDESTPAAEENQGGASSSEELAGGEEITNPETPANPDAPVDGETPVNPDAPVDGETPNGPETPVEDEPEEPEEPAEEETTYALDDSLEVTVDTKESSKNDPSRDENGNLLYTLGETAATTLTLSNPEAYSLAEDDGTIVRVTMQFTDTAVSDVDGVPYKDGSTVNEVVAAAEVADLITENTPAADPEAAANTANIALVTDLVNESETAKAAQHNDSYGKTQQAGSYTVAAQSGKEYTYTVAEDGNGLYTYEIARPTLGDSISLELTSVYGQDSNGGKNEILVEIIPGENKADEAEASDTENTEDAAEETSEEESTEPRKVYEQTLRWVANVDLVARKTTQSKETENYIVAVTYGADSQLPADAELSVTEYGPETEVYQRITEQTGESYDWLLDISFYYNGLELEPQAPIGIKVTAKAVEEEIPDNEHDKDAIAREYAAALKAGVVAGDENNLDDYEEIKSEETTAEETVTTITHFADQGTETIENDNVDVQENDGGQVETSFELGSLSLVAGTTYHTTTVTSYKDAQESNGDTFVIYKVNGDYVYYLIYYYGSLATLEVELSSLVDNIDSSTITSDNLTATGRNIYYKGTITGKINDTSATVNWKNLCWVRYQGYALQSAAMTTAFLAMDAYGLRLSWGVPYTVTFAAGKNATRYATIQRFDYAINFSSSSSSFVIANSTDKATNVTVAKVGNDYTHTNAASGTTAVYTGKISKLPVGFYTVKVEDKKLAPIGDVLYTIYYRADGVDDDGRPNRGAVAATVETADDDMRIDVGGLGLPKGSYVMEMTSVPTGYLCDDGYWTFEITDDQNVLDIKNKDGTAEGVIIVNPDSNLDMSKTAEVYDYANRVYQVDLTAHSEVTKASFDALNIHLVLDQSNSMLFPSGLKKVDTTAYVELTWKAAKSIYADLKDADKLNKEKVYYVIAQPQSSATVYALWYDTNSEKWAYQDASYYAKAVYRKELQNKNYSHIKSNDTNVVHPRQDAFESRYTVGTGDAATEYLVNGGRMNNAEARGAFNGDVTESNKTKKVEIYEAVDEFNRLHYLESSVCEMMQMLAAMNPHTKVTLDLFTSTTVCKDQVVLDNDGLATLLENITDITTEGGTRQDRALDHVKTHVDDDKGEESIVILITDGAPQTSTKDPIDVGEATYKISDVDSDGNPDGTAYERINYYANILKDNFATLVTVGLGMENVESGKKALTYISSDYTFYDDETKAKDEFNKAVEDRKAKENGTWWFQPQNSSALSSILCEQILSQVIKTEIKSEQGTVIDYISDSFYPVDPVPISKKGTGDTTITYKPVESGTRINLDGTICKDNDGSPILYDANKNTPVIGTVVSSTYRKDDDGNVTVYDPSTTNPGVGTILQDETGSWYVRWDTANISSEVLTEYTDKRILSATKKVSGWVHKAYKLKDDGTKIEYWAEGYKFDAGAVNKYLDESETYFKTVSMTENYSFNGRVYLKAKEDFVGGNAINTNGNDIDLKIDEELGITSRDGATLTLSGGQLYTYNKPTVNVHLLDMNHVDTEVTVYKGDTINEATIKDSAGEVTKAGNAPKDSVQFFYDEVAFQKLVSDAIYRNVASEETEAYKAKRNVLNRYGITQRNDYGCLDDSFSISYARAAELDEAPKALTSEMWAELLADKTVSVPYIYNRMDGEVGYLSFKLTKEQVTGQTADWKEHEAKVAAGYPNDTVVTDDTDHEGTNWIERYTLTVTYTAYELGDYTLQYNEEGYNLNVNNRYTDDEHRRPVENVYYGDEGPGKQVKKNITSGLNDGQGIVTSKNHHYVYAIDGKIVISKEIEKNLLSDKDQTFTFKLQRYIATKDVWEDVTETNAAGIEVTAERTITIPKGQTTVSTAVEWTGLPRGEYKIVEIIEEEDVHAVKDITVDTTQTNTYYSGSGTPNVIFKLGHDITNTNVISKATTQVGQETIYNLYTSYTGKPNGVLGVAKIKNTLNKYELPATGGTGTLPYELGGFAALLTTMFAGCSMWRRRRDGRRCG